MGSPETVQDGSTRTGSWRVYEPLQLDRILTAALDGFAEQGFHGTSVRDIASRVGVTLPSLYYHYTNKQGMLAALLLNAVEETYERTTQALAEADGDPVVELSNLVQCVALRMTARTKMAALTAELRFLGQEDQDRYHDWRIRVENRFLATLQRGAKSGVFLVDDVHITARAHLDMVRSIARWHQGGTQKDNEKLAMSYALLALRSVGVDITAQDLERATAAAAARSGGVLP